MDFMYNYEGNLGEKNGRINPLFACRDKPMCLSVLEQVVLGGHMGPHLLVLPNEETSPQRIYFCVHS